MYNFRGMGQFKPLRTTDANLTAAYEWLGKALKLELEGKASTMIDMALDRACMFELAGHGISMPLQARYAN